MDQIITRFNISIHAPREGGDPAAFPQKVVLQISIHAPREGGDVRVTEVGKRRSEFQSTPPARGATRGIS